MKKNCLKNSIKKKKTLSRYVLYSNEIENLFIILDTYNEITNKFFYKKNEFKSYKYDEMGSSPNLFNIYITSKHKEILNSNDSVIKEMFVKSLYHKYNDKMKKLKKEKLKGFNYFRHI